MINKIERIERLARVLQIGSCSCYTETREHSPSCNWYIIEEILRECEHIKNGANNEQF
jgi:hypothetical protein